MLSNIKAQTNQAKLWGLTSDGGSATGMGSLFNINTDGTGFTKLHVFEGTTPGETPVGTPLLANNGKIYGMVDNGCAYDLGGLYSYDTATKIYTLLYSFNDSSGFNLSDDVNAEYSIPNTLIQATDGKIYGLTAYGGYSYLEYSYYGGSIFCYDPATNNVTIVHTFNADSTGYLPGATLVQYTDGNLYGIATRGGSNGNGVIFSYNINTGAYSVVHDFTARRSGINGGALIVNPSHTAIYGVANDSATYAGLIFSFTPGNGNFNIILDGNNTSNFFPPRYLCAATDSLLYMVSDISTIQKADLTAGDITYTDNYDVIRGLTYSNGLLYAVGSQVGNGYGPYYLFSLDTSVNNDQTIIQTVTGGDYPSGAVTITSDGQFFWTWGTGGAATYGAMGYYNSNTQTDTTLFYFGASAAGRPRGTLLRVNSKLYGMTTEGGPKDQGTVFKYDIPASAFSVIHNFNGADGYFPATSALVQASNGKLYGTTLGGGIAGQGVVFSIDPATDSFKLEYPYAGALVGSFVQAHNGKLYGVGAYSIYCFDPDSLTFTAIHQFNSAEKDFFGFDGTMILAADSNLYGVCHTCLFSLNPATNVVTDLVFYPPQDDQPYYGVIQDTNHVIYGTMPVRVGQGYAYTYNPATTAFSQYQSETAGSMNTLLLGKDNNIYTMANIGDGPADGFTNAYNPGGIYSYNIKTDSFTLLFAFNDTTGFSPYGGLIETDSCFPVQVSLAPVICQGDTFVLNGAPLTVSGAYNHTVTAQSGCDSTTSVHLTVLPHATAFSATVCTGQSYMFGGVGRSGPGTYVHTFQNVKGCDSVVTLTLSIQPPDTSSIRAQICSGDSYSFFGNNLSIPGTYTHTGQTVNGCDSTVTLSLSFYPVLSIAIIVQGDTLTSMGQKNYQWLLNDTPVIGATKQVYVASRTGYYSLQVTDTTGCVTISDPVFIAGINNLSLYENISIYPNPSAGSWQLAVGEELVGAKLEVFDEQGRVVMNYELRITNYEVTAATLPQGVYYLRISNDKVSVVRKLVKM